MIGAHVGQRLARAPGGGPFRALFCAWRFRLYFTLSCQCPVSWSFNRSAKRQTRKISLSIQ